MGVRLTFEISGPPLTDGMMALNDAWRARERGAPARHRRTPMPEESRRDTILYPPAQTVDRTAEDGH